MSARRSVVVIGALVATILGVVLVQVAGPDDSGEVGDLATVSPEAWPTASPLPPGRAASDEPAQLYVDASDGSDDNPGTESAPFATITAAARRADELNRAGEPVHVRIAPGTYRETVELGSDGATAAPLTLEGQGAVILSGSDPVTDWTEVGDGIHQTPWTEDWGVSEVPPAWLDSFARDQLEANPVVLRREMVFVDGALQRPVTDAAELRATPGTFHVDEGANILSLHLPPGTTPDAVSVEVARRSTIFTLSRREDVTLRNLTLQHAASPAQGKALVISNARDITIEGLDVSWNSWVGIAVSRSADVVIADTVANNNGVGGLTGFESVGLEVVDSETSYNNWRGHRGAEDVEPGQAVDPTFIDFAAGQKFLYMRDVTFRRHTAVGNLASGLWLDFDNRNITIEDSLITDNLTWGIFFEASPGPFAVTGSHICRNEVGVYIANSANGTITESLLSDNALSQVHLGGRASRQVTDAMTRERYDVASEGWVLVDNDFGAQGSQSGFGATTDTDSWERFVSTLDSDGNRWGAENPGRLFTTADGEAVGLQEWQARTGHDTGSRITSDPDGNCD